MVAMGERILRAGDSHRLPLPVLPAAVPPLDDHELIPRFNPSKFVFSFFCFFATVHLHKEVIRKSQHTLYALKPLVIADRAPEHPSPADNLGGVFRCYACGSNSSGDESIRASEDDKLSASFRCTSRHAHTASHVAGKEYKGDGATTFDPVALWIWRPLLAHGMPPASDRLRKRSLRGTLSPGAYAGTLTWVPLVIRRLIRLRPGLYRQRYTDS